MKENTTETGLVQQTEQTGVANIGEKAYQFYGENSFAIFTTLPLDKKAAIVRAMGDSDYNIKEEAMKNPGLVINIHNILNHMVRIVNDEGQEVPGKRSVIIDDQGKTWSSVAEGVISSLGNLFNLYGLPPYNPPLKVNVKQVKTRKGYYTMNLEPLDD